MPEQEIDGLDVTEMSTGLTDESPHEAYFYYYNVNELWAIRHRDWKMYFPHTYNSLSGRDGGLDGLPTDYDRITLDTIELYNLSNDRRETTDVADEYPDIVSQLMTMADKKRKRIR